LTQDALIKNNDSSGINCKDKIIRHDGKSLNSESIRDREKSRIPEEKK
jgi:hypothetical protein